MAFVKFNGGVRTEIPYAALETYLTVFHGNCRWSLVWFLTL